MGEPRYVVQSVEMYDVVDTLTDEIIFNTRSQSDAQDYADEHERIYNQEESASGVHEAD